MKTPARFLLELFGPGLIVGTVFSVLTLVDRMPDVGLSRALVGWMSYSWSALVSCGVQSVCYATLMEIGFWRGMQPKSWTAVSLSLVLGLVSGVSIAVWPLNSPVRESFLFFGILGAFVGLVISFITWLASPNSKQKAAQPGATDNPDDAQRLREDT